MSEKLEKPKSYCHHCGCDTNHIILHEEKAEYSGTEECGNTDWWKKRYQMIQCCGCDGITYRTISLDDSCNIETYDGEKFTVPDIKTYPYVKGELKPLMWNMEIPIKVSAIFIEAINCYNCNYNLLSAAGFRSVVDAICADKNIQEGNLEKNIEKLFIEGYITGNDKKRLHAIRFMGNDALHEIKTPSRFELYVVYEIIHTLIKALYIIPQQAESLKSFPLTDPNELFEVIASNIQDAKLGDNLTFEELIRGRKIIKNDKKRLIDELNSAIRTGVFPKLKIVQMGKGKQQKYQIQNIF